LFIQLPNGLRGPPRLHGGTGGAQFFYQPCRSVLRGKLGGLADRRGGLVDFFGLDEGFAEVQCAEGEVARKDLSYSAKPARALATASWCFPSRSR